MGIIKVFGRRSKRNFILCWLLLTVLFILYTEFLTYYRNTSTWNSPLCTDNQSCTRILLVADPQLIGSYNEILHFLTPLTIYDSDRYLLKTYSYAFNYADPDVVIFLGDVMDEGSTAKNDEEFNSYVRRVFNIFLSPEKSVRHIWLPGDNDIGGESSDRVTDLKVKRFNRAFSQPDLIRINNYSFFKINVMAQYIPVYKEKREFYNPDGIFIGLSHMPILYLPTKFVDKVLTKMLPQLIFSAHEHKSMIVSTDALLRDTRQIVPIDSDNHVVYSYELAQADMYEIIVPTCSYRMGTDKIGYGLAVLDKNNLQYTVLWSPPRFEQLMNYVLFITCFIVSNFCFYCCRLSYKHI